jgi:TetR/AcrR family transcriptional regulator, tetracycline repressor protein
VPGRRQPLSREAILRTAVAFADEHGLTALTMRRLGEVLGVEAMSLYYHVNGREDLLEGMVGEIVSGVQLPGADDLGPQDHWQVFLQFVAHQVREVATAHPNLFPLVATRPPAAPWLRPPLRSLELVEEFLSGLVARGLPDDAAVQVYKVFTSFLLGQLLLEVAQLGAETGPPDEPLDEGGADVPPESEQEDLAGRPTVLRLRDRLAHHDTRAEFEQALEALLDRLDRELSQ